MMMLRKRWNLAPPSYRFCEEVAGHFISWTVLNCDVLALLYICDKEVSDVHVPHFLAARCSSISLKLLATQVILMYFCRPKRVSLSVKEITHPQNG